MTFAEFQTTRVWCDDLGAKLQDAHWEGEPDGKGNVYLDCLFIEQVQPHWPEASRALGKWHLLIGRADWISDDLEMLERKLYQFALDEGYIQ